MQAEPAVTEMSMDDMDILKELEVLRTMIRRQKEKKKKEKNKKKKHQSSRKRKK